MTCFWRTRRVVFASIEVMPHTSYDVTYAFAAFMAASLRVSAFARRVAAAYGDANVLRKRAKMHDFLYVPTCTLKTPKTKKMRLLEISKVTSCA